jgi:hypothetical protein
MGCPVVHSGRTHLGAAQRFAMMFSIHFECSGKELLQELWMIFLALLADWLPSTLTLSVIIGSRWTGKEDGHSK